MLTGSAVILFCAVSSWIRRLVAKKAWRLTSLSSRSGLVGVEEELGSGGRSAGYKHGISYELGLRK